MYVCTLQKSKGGKKKKEENKESNKLQPIRKVNKLRKELLGSPVEKVSFTELKDLVAPKIKLLYRDVKRYASLK